MQAMPRTAAAVGHRALPAATTLIFGGGLAVYQMTSLVLGPPATRQLQLSLTIPALARNDRTQPVASNVMLVLGSSAMVGTPSPGVGIATPRRRIAATHASAVAPSPPASLAVTASPVATPGPRPSDHPCRPVVPTPHPAKDEDAD
jgi:hypothetical protein